jgi:hypothetical protein
MGFDTSAITIIGLRIRTDQTVIEESLPYINCNCQNNTNNFSFCPDCGKKNQFGFYKVETKRPEIQRANDCDDRFYFTFYGYPMLECMFDREEWLYLSLWHGVRDGPRSYQPETETKCPYNLEELTVLKNKMKDTVGDLWKDEHFGIYTICEFSY